MEPRSNALRQAASPRITVIGSYAAGLSMRLDRLPAAGETVIGTAFEIGPGGKGSNQAIQCARLGASVSIVAAVGRDAFGDAALGLWQREGVEVGHVARVADRPTGAGMILVERSGENRIVIDPGANALLGAPQLAAARDTMAASQVVIAQLEIDPATALAGLGMAGQAGAITILNPAPAQPLTLESLRGIHVVTPNAGELRALAGRLAVDDGDDTDDARRLLAAGVGAVVVTRGPAGARIVRPDGVREVPSPRVEVVDTTGAGDAFSATLAVALAEGRTLDASVERAVVAGALACTRHGVVPALPSLDELERALSSGEPERADHDTAARSSQ